MQAAQQKEADRAALVEKVNGELRERVVTPADVREFSKFAVPSALYNAQGRPLTDAEASIITQLLMQPVVTKSTDLDKLFRATAILASCDCSMPGCQDCAGAPFEDATYKSFEECPRFPQEPRSGRINQIPFSIFLPKDQRKPKLD